MQCKGEKSRGFLVKLCCTARVYREASAGYCLTVTACLKKISTRSWVLGARKKSTFEKGKLVELMLLELKQSAEGKDLSPRSCFQVVSSDEKQWAQAKQWLLRPRRN
jgi:hypothetical protein